MQLREPRPKRHCGLSPNLPLPLINTPKGEIRKFSGNFDGFSVIIQQPEDMKALNSMGYFGKANLSRSFPTFFPQENKPQIIRQRQFKRRQDWVTKCTGKPEIRKVIVLPDTDSENDDYFTNLKPEYQFDTSQIQETLNLTLEEAFFLFHGVGILKIYESQLLLGEGVLWQKFCQTDTNFVQNYMVYQHFREKNWVVKPGIKFGGDFLLYKEGPPFYHASYVVIIDVVDSETMLRREDLCRRSMDMTLLGGLNRLCETAGKELLLCQLIWPTNVTEPTLEHLPIFKINDILMRRWVSSQKRALPDN